MDLVASHEKRLKTAVQQNMATMRQVRRLLRQATRSGVSGEQFEIFRANYLLRTCTTPMSVAAVVAQALRQAPPDLVVARSIANEALFDELGPPDGKSHVELLLRAMDVVATRSLGLQPLGLDGIGKHPRILQAAVDFHHHQMQVFSSQDYPEMLGALYGRERAAAFMLKVIQQCIFEPLLPCLSIADQRKVRIYFDVHLSEDDGGAEVRHAKAALRTLEPHLGMHKQGAAVCAGAEATLRLQGEFFLAIANALAA